MRRLVPAALALAVVTAAAAAVVPHSGPGGAGVAARAGATEAVPATAPRHVATWIYYGGADQNEDVPAAWIAAHADFAEADASQPEFIERFKKAGGRTAVAYTDPTYVPHCVPPFAPPAGPCTGQIGDLKPPESAWLHDERGERVRRPDAFTHQYQEALNPLSPAARGAYRLFTERVVERAPHLDLFLADDSGGPLKGGDGTARSGLFYRFDNEGSEIRSDEEWIQAELAMLESAARPVIYNGNDPATKKPAYDGVFLRAPNVRGEMLEGCFLSDAFARPLSDANRLWQRYADGLLAVTRSHRVAACVQISNLLKDPGARLYGLASWWLTYDAQHSVIGLLGGGADGHSPFAEEAIVPRAPQRTAESIEQLRDAQGAYARTFGRCFQDGRILGPCAAVVNPSPVATVAMPPELMRYRHALALDARSAYAGGRATWTAGVPRDLPPLTAAVLLR